MNHFNDKFIYYKNKNNPTQTNQQQKMQILQQEKSNHREIETLKNTLKNMYEPITPSISMDMSASRKDTIHLK
jgi:hypothetical protein